jgi:hypothetical protein
MSDLPQNASHLCHPDRAAGDEGSTGYRLIVDSCGRGRGVNLRFTTLSKQYSVTGRSLVDASHLCRDDTNAARLMNWKVALLIAHYPLSIVNYIR